MIRRDFFKTGSFAALGLLGSTSLLASNTGNNQLNKNQRKVNFTRDGLDLSPLEYSVLLEELAEKKKIVSDTYSRGGTVEALEEKMAKLLGMESAVFMPTGTLANHIALRKHCGIRKRVILHADSHIYRDSGDCITTISGLNPIPLGKGSPSFTLENVREAVDRTSAGRVHTEIGAVALESPVRRHHNRVFDLKSMAEISVFARTNGIPVHLDGARLFNACVHFDKKPEEFTSFFDTVYISLYKNFNAASGAILAGSKSFTKDLYQTRRMFGGGMPSVWPFASVAIHYLESFTSDYASALDHAQNMYTYLENNGNFKVEKYADGTNIVKLKLINVDAVQLKTRLEEKNIHLFDPGKNKHEILLKINPSILRRDAEELATDFILAAK